MSNDLSSEAVQLGPPGLLGDLVIAAQALGLVLFVHGSGSSRKSPRNRGVASVLQQHHLVTLLFDLLTEEEALDPSQVNALAPSISGPARKPKRPTQCVKRLRHSSSLSVLNATAPHPAHTAVADASPDKTGMQKPGEDLP